MMLKLMYVTPFTCLLKKLMHAIGKLQNNYLCDQLQLLCAKASCISINSVIEMCKEIFWSCVSMGDSEGFYFVISAALLNNYSQFHFSTCDCFSAIEYSELVFVVICVYITNNTQEAVVLPYSFHPLFQNLTSSLFLPFQNEW